MRRNKQHRSRRSQHRPCNPLYQRGRERSYHTHMDQDCQASGLRCRTSMTIRRYQRPHQILVGHSQFPNIMNDTSTSASKLPGPVKDDKPPGGDREHHGIGKTNFDKRKRYLEIKTFLSKLSELPIHSEPKSPELPDHFDFRPDTSSDSSNTADHEPIPNEHNVGYQSSLLKSLRTSTTL